MSDLHSRVQSLNARIQAACARCGRSPESVELLPVSKFQPQTQIQEALLLGFRRFGENYVQEGTAKAAAIPDADFILIGPLQRNKAKQALLHFQEIMSVDRPELVLRLRNLARELSLTRKIWIQVDLWNESTKLGGCAPNDLPSILEAWEKDPSLPLEGLMAIPPPEHNTAFTELADFREVWQQRLGKPLRLSMGMSGDLEAAICAGSDQVRIGTALFGDRC